MTSRKRELYKAELTASIESASEDRDELRYDGRAHGFLILPDEFNYCGNFLSHGLKCLWQVIFSHNWNQNPSQRVSWPGLERLAILMGTSSRQVTTYIQGLKEKGLLNTKRRPNLSSLYILHDIPGKYMRITKAKLKKQKQEQRRQKEAAFKKQIQILKASSALLCSQTLPKVLQAKK